MNLLILFSKRLFSGKIIYFSGFCSGKIVYFSHVKFWKSLENQDFESVGNHVKLIAVGKISNLCSIDLQQLFWEKIQIFGPFLVPFLQKSGPFLVPFRDFFLQGLDIVPLGAMLAPHVLFCLSCLLDPHLAPGSYKFRSVSLLVC